MRDRKHRGVAADDERDEHDGGGADRRGLRQNAEPEPEILEELLEPRRHPHGAGLLLDAGDISQRAPCGGHGVGFGFPTLHVVACFLCEVKPELLIELAVCPGGKEDEPDERSNAGPEHHGLLVKEATPGPSTRATAADRRLHRVRSTAS